MKIDTVKFLFAIAIGILLGVICEIIAQEADGRNWISLIVGSLTIMSGLIPAMGIVYKDPKRGVSIKVLSWIVTLVLLITNLLFALKEYKIDVYIAVVLLMAVMGWGMIYGVYRLKSAKR